MAKIENGVGASRLNGRDYKDVSVDVATIQEYGGVSFNSRSPPPECVGNEFCWGESGVGLIINLFIGIYIVDLLSFRVACDVVVVVQHHSRKERRVGRVAGSLCAET